MTGSERADEPSADDTQSTGTDDQEPTGADGSGTGNDPESDERPWEPDDRTDDAERRRKAIRGDVDLDESSEAPPFGTGRDETPERSSGPDGKMNNEGDASDGVHEQDHPVVPLTPSQFRERLGLVRGSAQKRQVRTVHAALLALLVTTYHPVGVPLGGALVALPQRSVRRGLLAGGVYGLLVLALFRTSLLGMAPLTGVPTFGIPLLVSGAIAIGGSVVGSAVRAVV